MKFFSSSFFFINLIITSSFIGCFKITSLCAQEKNNHRITISQNTYFRLNKPKQSGSSLKQLLMQNELDSKQFKSDISFLFYSEVNKISFSVSQLWYKSSKIKHFKFGVQKLEWNKFEKFWQLAILNKQRSYSLLDDKRDGLIGIDYQNKIYDFNVDIFVSWFFLPQLSPGFDIISGDIKSRSDWGISHPEYYQTPSGNLYPIKYKIGQYKLSDILLQKTFGINISNVFVTNKLKITTNLFSIYKPESVLQINADISIDNNSLYANVLVFPWVNHHLLNGINTALKLDNHELMFSFVDSNPNVRVLSDLKFLEQKLSKDKFVSQYLRYDPTLYREEYFEVNYKYKSSAGDVKLAFIKSFLQNFIGDSFRSSRVKWKEAIGAECNFSLFNNIFHKVSLKYDLKNFSNILNIENNFKYKKAILSVGLQLIQAPDDTSFWSDFRTNDAIYTSLKYMF